MKTIIMIITFILGITTISFALDFGVDSDNTWANTPVGMFECKEVRSNGDVFQELKLAGKVISRKSRDEIVLEGKTIQSGIVMYEDVLNCPSIIESKAGYVIYEVRVSLFGMAGQAPSDVVYGNYAINFNVMPPIIINLAQLDSNRTQPKTPFVWDKDGFTMHYYGYPHGVWWSESSKKSKLRSIRFDFKTQKVKQIK